MESKLDSRKSGFNNTNWLYLNHSMVKKYYIDDYKNGVLDVKDELVIYDLKNGVSDIKYVLFDANDWPKLLALNMNSTTARLASSLG